MLNRRYNPYNLVLQTAMFQYGNGPDPADVLLSVETLTRAGMLAAYLPYGAAPGAQLKSLVNGNPGIIGLFLLVKPAYLSYVADEVRRDWRPSDVTVIAGADAGVFLGSGAGEDWAVIQVTWKGGA